MKHLVLVIFLSAAAMLRADPAPSLTWTGGPVLVVAETNNDGPNLSVSGGPDVDVWSCFSSSACVDIFQVDQYFTVTSPGIFTLSTSLSADGVAFNCNPGECQPSATMSISLNGDTAIFSPDYSTYFSQPFSDSDPETTNCNGNEDGCEAEASLSDARSDLVFLGLGNYALEENYDVSGTGSGDLSWGGAFNSSLGPGSLIPVPEPRGVAVSAVAFLLLVWLKATRHESRTRPTHI
jgi:hypothetical protein